MTIFNVYTRKYLANGK